MEQWYHHIRCHRLRPGPISLIARDINGCTVTASTTINTLPKAVISLSLINATCGMSNGSISINNTNGVPIASYIWSNGATTSAINGLAAGLSSITATDINGCTVTASANINAIPKDSLVLISSNTTCGKLDGRVMVSVFSGLAATAYQWSNGATSQNLINAPGGSYTVTALDKNNCPISGKATIIALTNPTVSLGADIPFQQGKQYVLDATGTGLTYLWSTGATTPTITATASGNYSVTVMNTLGCKASDTIALTITTATHIVDSKFNITVSPNPTNGRILISAAGRSIPTLELIDHLGRRLLLDHNKISDGSSHILHLDKLPSGSYYLRMIGKGWSKTVGVLKQ